MAAAPVPPPALPAGTGEGHACRRAVGGLARPGGRGVCPLVVRGVGGGGTPAPSGAATAQIMLTLYQQAAVT
jgi:hypothetical protein